MFCYKDNCDIDITKFSAQDNKDNDCFLHLMSGVMEHYSALKDRTKHLEYLCNKYERKLKRLIEETKSTKVTPVKSKKSKHDEENLPAPTRSPEADLLNRNLNPESDVVQSTYAVPNNPLSPINGTKRNGVKRRNSKDVSGKAPEIKNKIKKPEKSATINKSSIMERSFLSKSKSKSYIQPTLNFFQPRTPKPQEECQDNEDVDMTYCPGLDTQVSAPKLSNEMMPPPADPPKKVSPKRISLSLNKQNKKKKEQQEDEEEDIFDFRPFNITESEEKKEVPAPSEAPKNPDVNKNIKLEKKSPVSKPPVAKPEDDNITHTSLSLFDTEDVILGDSVIILDSERPENPIVIPDDSNQDSEDLLNMERQFLRDETNQFRYKSTLDDPLDDPEMMDLPWSRRQQPNRKDPTAERSRTPDFGCKNCEEYYKFLRKTCSTEDILKRLKCSHNNRRAGRAVTPEGFWNVDFTPTEQ